MKDGKKRMIRDARRKMEKASRYFASTGDEEFAAQYVALRGSIETMYNKHEEK